MDYKAINSAIEPHNYTLHFDVADFRKKEQTTFSGHETISLVAKKPIAAITLHQQGLHVKNAIVLSAKKKIVIPEKAIRYDHKKHTVLLPFGKKVTGKVLVSLDFTGSFGQGAGLYRSEYQEKNGKTAYMLTTQMEPAHAREVFPCIDEPAAKATFDISLTVPKELDTLANMLPQEEKLLGNDKKQVIFATTPKMSPYLFYLGAGEFEYLTDSFGAITLRVVTTPGKSSKGRFALLAAKKIIAYYGEYFGIAYPLHKLDLIAVPDFVAGAMENWGAITFRETALLYDEETSSLSEKQRVATVVSHEIVHQWFGNLVTMRWWNDLWLNESFAEFMAHKAINVFWPELEPWAEFLYDVRGAYHLDSLKSSHPIHVAVDVPEEIEEIFDAISYEKGGMILRMLEAFIGGELFRKGLHRYLSTFSHANAVGMDLWKALADVSGKPIPRIMDKWLTQAGHPVVYVTYEKEKLKATQKRFLYRGSTLGTTWPIPLTVTTDKKTVRCIMNNQRMDIALPGQHRWIKVNSNETGFYRVDYMTSMREKNAAAVASKELNAIDRWGMHKDITALCLATDVPLSDYLSFIASYNDEDDYLVLMDIISSINKIALLTYGTNSHQMVAHAATALYRSLLKKFGWEKRQGERETDMQLRALLITSLGRLEDKTVLDKTRALFEQFLQDKTAVHPDLRSALYTVLAWQATQKEYDQLYVLYRKEQGPAEKVKLLAALAGCKNKILLAQTLDMLFSKEVRMQDAFYIPTSMSANPSGKLLVWPWLKKKWTTVKAKYSTGFSPHFSTIITSLSTMANTAEAKNIQVFMKKNPVPGTTRSIRNMVETMSINERFLRSIAHEKE